MDDTESSSFYDWSLSMMIGTQSALGCIEPPIFNALQKQIEDIRDLFQNYSMKMCHAIFSRDFFSPIINWQIH